MEQQKAFEIIKEVFTKAVNSFHNDKITNDADWESHLYCMFRDALGEISITFRVDINYNFDEWIVEQI